MDSSGFSSPRAECFPAGLRVLVVDDDPTWLKILEKMLKRCNYEVTTCNLAREALDLLRERKDGFDIVISDVNMPDMDGFKLLEHVGLEMDLPVIMMSVDGETSRVMKGVQHGACDYLLKPIRMKELRNIWQHVFRKRIHEVRDIEGYESIEEIQMMRCGTEQLEDGFLFSGDFISGKKRKDVDSKYDDRACGDPSSAKKTRVVWTVDLHQKFVKAVNQIGFEKVGPKKILDLMGVPWLTRENVASHLQKYRLYLSRLQKENELKTSFGGTKDLDIFSKDLAGNVSLHSSIIPKTASLQQNILPNESYAIPSHKIPPVHIDEPKISKGNVNGVLSMTITESKKSQDTTDLAKSSASRISFGHSFEPPDSDIKSEPKTQVQYSWSSEVASLQFNKEYKPHFRSEYLFDPMHHIQVSAVEPSLSHNPGTSSKESDKPAQVGTGTDGNSRSQGTRRETKVESRASLFSVQPESHLTDSGHTIDPIPYSLWNSRNDQNPNLNPFDDLESSHRNLIIGTGSALRLWDEEFNDYSSQGDFYPANAYIGNIESIGYNAAQELISDVPPHLYDVSSEPVEYPVIDQGLFA